MRKRIVALAASLGLAAVLVPFGSSAQAAPECIGSPVIPESYVCIVRREIGRITVTQGPIVNTLPFCALLLCVEEQHIPLVDVAIDDDEVTVLYYMGKCYYVGNGNVVTQPASSTNPPNCP